MADSDALTPVKQKLERYLGELYGAAVQRDPEGDWAIMRGSAIVFIRPIELMGDRTGVRVWSVTNVDVRVDDELTRFILVENGRIPFGVLHLAEDRPAVALGYTLLGGDLLNRAELEVAVNSVAKAADDYDDVIKTRFGGRTFGEPG